MTHFEPMVTKMTHAFHIWKPILAAKEWMIDKINMRSMPVRPCTVVNKNFLCFHICPWFISPEEGHVHKSFFMMKTKLRKSHSRFRTIVSNKAWNKASKDSWALSCQIAKVKNMSDHVNDGQNNASISCNPMKVKWGIKWNISIQPFLSFWALIQVNFLRNNAKEILYRCLSYETVYLIKIPP